MVFALRVQITFVTPQCSACGQGILIALQVAEAPDRFHHAQVLALQAAPKAARNLALKAPIRKRSARSAAALKAPIRKKSARSAAALEVADVDAAQEARAEEDAIAVEAEGRANVTDLDHDNEDIRSCHIL